MGKIENFKIQVFKENSIELDNLIAFLQTHEQLNSNQWLNACFLIDTFIQKNTLDKYNPSLYKGQFKVTHLVLIHLLYY